VDGVRVTLVSEEKRKQNKDEYARANNDTKAEHADSTSATISSRIAGTCSRGLGRRPPQSLHSLVGAFISAGRPGSVAGYRVRRRSRSVASPAEDTF
jgi:hypothetical protein